MTDARDVRDDADFLFGLANGEPFNVDAKERLYRIVRNDADFLYGLANGEPLDVDAQARLRRIARALDQLTRRLASTESALDFAQRDREPLERRLNNYRAEVSALRQLVRDMVDATVGSQFGALLRNPDPDSWQRRAARVSINEWLTGSTYEKARG